MVFTTEGSLSNSPTAKTEQNACNIHNISKFKYITHVCTHTYTHKMYKTYNNNFIFRVFNYIVLKI